MPAKINISGAKKEIVTVMLNDAGTSKEASRVLLNIGGVAKEVYTSNLYEGAVTVGTQLAYSITSHGYLSYTSNDFGSITPETFAPDIRMRMVQSSTAGPYVWVEIDSLVFSKQQLEQVVRGWKKLKIGPYEIDLTLPASDVIVTSYDDFFNQGVMRGTLQINNSVFFSNVHSYLSSKIGGSVVVVIK